MGADESAPGGESMRLRLSPDPAAVPRARHWVIGCLRELGIDGDVEADVALVASELVTNAVVHTTGELELVVSRPGPLRLELHDDAAQEPVLRPPSPDLVGGRGLHIVAALASRWGYGPSPILTKVVWVEFDDDVGPI